MNYSPIFMGVTLKPKEFPSSQLHWNLPGSAVHWFGGSLLRWCSTSFALKWLWNLKERAETGNPQSVALLSPRVFSRKCWGFCNSKTIGLKQQNRGIQKLRCMPVAGFIEGQFQRNLLDALQTCLCKMRASVTRELKSLENGKNLRYRSDLNDLIILIILIISSFSDLILLSTLDLFLIDPLSDLVCPHAASISRCKSGLRP